MENKVRLPVVFCLVVDFPSNNIDCGTVSDGTGEQVCFECPRPGKFLTGDSMDDHGSPGHVICAVLWVFIVAVGVFAACANTLIITVVKKHNEPRAFDFMLTILASFDLLSSTMAVISSTAMIVFYEGVSRGPLTLFLYYVPFLFCLIGRSGSVYMTVLITIERYLVIAFPLKSFSRFTTLKTKLSTLCVAGLAILINIPRFTSIVISYNYKGQNIHSLRNLTHIVRATGLEKFWYDTLGSVHYAIDIWAPFPVLIIFNVLLFIEIRKFTTKRIEINQKLKRDIRAARMFVPVVFVLFICNLEPITHYILLYFQQVYYRELVFGLTLSIVLNAAANLPIYYARGPSFRDEIRTAINDIFSKKGVSNRRCNRGDKSSREMSSTTAYHKNDNNNT